MSKFPVITHINDVLPFIEGKEEFDIKRREKYIAIDYVFEKEDTFTHSIHRECRGLKFYPDGRIMARNFHKFFNLNQTEETKFENIDWSYNHIIMEKLDGSMCGASFLDDGTLTLMTRAGITDVSMKAEKYLTNDIRALCQHLHEKNVTPIFEFIAPDNRIVIRYEQPELILLAARHIETGYYLCRHELEILAGAYYVPIVKVYDFNSTMSPSQFVEHTRKLEGMEGFVVHFQNNDLLLKIKGDDYVLKHRTKSYFDHEKNVLEIVLQDKVDDLIPLLDEKQVETLTYYANAVNCEIFYHADMILGLYQMNSSLSKKDFAVGPAKSIDARLRSVMFNCYGNNYSISDVVEMVKVVYAKNNTQTKIDENRDLIGCLWNPFG